MNKQMIIYGIRPVLELLRSDKEVETIFLQKDLKSEWASEIKKVSKENSIPLKFVPKFKLNKLTKKNHQGVIAIGSIISYQNFENVLSYEFEKGNDPIFILLDRITDVRNFGSICRSVEANGITGVIIPNRESALINEIAMKASAGALNNINIFRTDNLRGLLKYAKNCGLCVVGCSEKSNKNIYEASLNKPSIIIIGSEKNGISDNLLLICDEIIKIPISGKTSSLNASVAAGIALYEQKRQFSTS